MTRTVSAGWSQCGKWPQSSNQRSEARLRAALEDGRVSQSLTHLAWSYAHMQGNRLGIELVPEALLRYFLYRFWSEQAKR